jgi:hypothetical protein
VVRLRREVRRGLAVAAGAVTIPLVLLWLAVVWVVSTWDGCEIVLPDSLISDLGVRPGPGGAVAVDRPPCTTAGAYVALVLRGPDGTVLWRADASAGRQVATFTVGRPPEGFSEVVPLAAPLDPATRYTVQMFVIPPAPGAADPDAGLPFGGRATFRPADLRADRVWFRGRSVTPAEFSRQGCASETPATAAST